MDTRSLSRVRSLAALRGSRARRHISFLEFMVLERKQPQQQPIQHEWPLNRVVDDAFPVDQNLDSRHAIRDYFIDRTEVLRAYDALYRDHLFFPVYRDILLPFDDQVAVGQD